MSTEAKKKTFSRPKWEETNLNLPENVIEYFASRGISANTLKANKIAYGPEWMPAENKSVTCIQFPYYKGGNVVNVKYRDGKKNFRQAKDAEKCFYRFDEIASMAKKTATLYITEGEMDALAMYECGIHCVTSIPDGAPSPGTKNYEKKFTFLESAEELIAAYGKIVLVVDNDAPGQTLERELARRIGCEKCWRVTYPEGCKDINDVLVKLGQEAVAKVLKEAVAFPVEGLFALREIEEDVMFLYDNGLKRGVSSGWNSLDPFWRIRPGEMTIVTGIPGSGKSNWLDALLVKLRYNHDWSVAIFSPENWPVQRHVANLVEKIVQKPFSPQYSNLPRMTKEELSQGLEFMDGFFTFIVPPEDQLSLDDILAKAKAAVFRYGCKALVIDPWNEIEHSRNDKMSETEYISVSLSKIRNFSRWHDIHVFVVAHPQKLQKEKDSGKYNPPSMYDISGSAHWRNKADNGICIHRPDVNVDVTEVIIQKIRFKENGKLGTVKLAYNRDCGIYFDLEDTEGLAAVVNAGAVF